MKNLNAQFAHLENWLDGKLGVSAIHVPTMTRVAYNADTEFSLCSIYKIPIAICLLQKVESGDVKLEQLIAVQDYDLRSGANSTLNQLDYMAPVTMSVLNLLQFMLQESCNSASDIILKLVGGPLVVRQSLQEMGLTQLNVDRYIIEQNADEDGITGLLPTHLRCTLQEYKSLQACISKETAAFAKENFRADKRDFGTPAAMTELLLKLVQGEILNRTHTDLILTKMQRCKTSDRRIMGLLPPQTKVAHKTGSVPGYEVHDAGVIFLPQTNNFMLITVFTETNAKPHINAAERVIAEVTRTIFDYYRQLF